MVSALRTLLCEGERPTGPHRTKRIDLSQDVHRARHNRMDCRRATDTSAVVRPLIGNPYDVIGKLPIRIISSALPTDDVRQCPLPVCGRIPA